jgi:hypothetical protein
MPDVSTEVAIATQTLGSNASTLTFSSISSAYTDLRLVLNRYATTGAGSGYLTLRFNSDTGANYSATYISGDGSAASSSRTTSATSMIISAGGSVEPDLLTLDIFSYAGSTFKTCLSTYAGNNNGATFEYVSDHVGLWRSTAAITSITLIGNAGTNSFQAGTKATLYGIL